MPRRRRKPRPGPARYLAPAAFLAGVTVAVLLVNAGLNGGKPETTTTVGGTVTQPRTTTHSTTSHAKAKRFYTVQSGDTFGAIASNVGISISQLEALNPGVSSNSLRVGQRLRVK